jgi:hypothetical protein
MDNTSANLKAMKLLVEQHPTWIAFGCSAHALALLMKDIGKDTKCSGVAEVLQIAQRMSLVYGDCSTVRELLHQHMMTAYGRKKMIRQHAPTRFATMHFVVSDLLDCQQAIFTMCSSEAWAAAASSSTNSDAFTDNATNMVL